MTQLAILTDTPQTGTVFETPYGPSAPIRAITLGGGNVLACAQGNADPRATMRALKDQGTTHVWLCESVGSLSVLLESGDWLVADDYIDGTRGQHYTYFNEKAGGYVQQAPAFDADSREALINTLTPQPPQGEGRSGRAFKRGVYVCVSNTRLETPAEAAFWMRAGGHVVGRFLSPCLTLARELEMKVAVLVQVRRAGGEPGESVALETYLAVIENALAALNTGA